MSNHCSSDVDVLNDDGDHSESESISLPDVSIVHVDSAGQTREDCTEAERDTCLAPMISSSELYSQVLFENVKSSYPIGAHIQCCFRVTKGLSVSKDDWIGLIRVGWRSVSEHLASELVDLPVGSENIAGTVLFRSCNLPSDDDDCEFYHFCYVSGNDIRGASLPFQFKQPRSSDSGEFVALEDEDLDMMVVESTNAHLHHEISKIQDKLVMASQEAECLKESKEKLRDVLVETEESMKNAVCRSEQLSDRIHQLEERMETVLTENREMTVVHKQLTEDISRVNQERSEIMQRLDQNEKYVVQLREKEREITVERDSVKAKCEQLAEERTLFKNHFSRSEIEVSDLANEVDRMKASLTQRNDEVYVLKGQVTKLKGQLIDQADVVKNFNLRIVHDKRHMEDLTEKLRNAEEKLTAAEEVKQVLNADFEALREAYGKAQQDLEELRSELRLSHSNSQNNTSFLEERIESLNQRLISKTKEAEEGNKEAAAASITAEESEELLASKTDEIDALRMQMEFQSERISSLETQLEEAKNQSVIVETPRPIEMRTIATSVPTACGEPAQDREESFCIVRDGQQHEATPSEVESCISTVPPPRAEVMSRDETPPRNEEGAMHALQLVNNHLKEKLNKYKIKTEKLQAKNAELVRASRAKDSIMADMEVDLSAMKGKLMQTAEDYKTKYQECRRMTKTMQRKETRHHANKHAHVETTHPKLHKEKEASGKSPVAIKDMKKRRQTTVEQQQIRNLDELEAEQQEMLSRQTMKPKRALSKAREVETDPIEMMTVQHCTDAELQKTSAMCGEVTPIQMSSYDDAAAVKVGLGAVTPAKRSESQTSVDLSDGEAPEHPAPLKPLPMPIQPHVLTAGKIAAVQSVMTGSATRGGRIVPIPIVVHPTQGGAARVIAERPVYPQTPRSFSDYEILQPTSDCEEEHFEDAPESSPQQPPRPTPTEYVVPTTEMPPSPQPSAPTSQEVPSLTIELDLNQVGGRVVSAHVTNVSSNLASNNQPVADQQQCPVCGTSVDQIKNGDLSRHVNSHFEAKGIEGQECPICQCVFPMAANSAYERHVTNHFKDSD